MIMPSPVTSPEHYTFSLCRHVEALLASMERSDREPGRHNCQSRGGPNQDKKA